MTEKGMLMDIKPLTTRALIIEDTSPEWKLLIIKKIDENGHITYTFPGGHLQEGEYPTNGLAREVEEETGVPAPFVMGNTPVEIFRHYKIDKKQPERGNGIMAWYEVSCAETPTVKGSYFEHDKWVIPAWVTLADFLKIKENDIKPDFIKPYILEQTRAKTHESKWLEEVYTC